MSGTPVQRGGEDGGKGPRGRREDRGPEGDRDPRRQEFEETALPHIDALYNAAFKLVRDPAEAEDLVQDTFVRAYRFFSQYQRGSNCKAWLFTILRNAFINRYRRSRGRPDTVAFDAIEGHSEKEIATVRDPAPRTPEDIVADARLGESVRAALDSLPPEYRMVVLLSIVEGYTYKEIASIMSCPIGTVMSRLFRARQILQGALQGHAKERGLAGRDAGRVSPMVDAGRDETGGRSR